MRTLSRILAASAVLTLATMAHAESPGTLTEVTVKAWNRLTGKQPQPRPAPIAQQPAANQPAASPSVIQPVQPVGYQYPVTQTAAQIVGHPPVYGYGNGHAYGNGYGYGGYGCATGDCRTIPMPGGPKCDYQWRCGHWGYFHPSGCGGAGCPKYGNYHMAYAVNPWYADRRDHMIYAAQYYNMPMAVPLAPNVEHTYNYSWGIPSSRRTPISRHIGPGQMIYPY